MANKYALDRNEPSDLIVHLERSEREKIKEYCHGRKISMSLFLRRLALAAIEEEDDLEAA